MSTGILFTPPRLGITVAGSLKLFAYEPGSTTKRNTYTTSALSVANSNPLVADSAGLFAAVYMDPSLGYKFVLAPANDTDPPVSPILTQDNAYLPAMVLPQVLSKVFGDSPYTVTAADGFDVLILCDATGGSMTIVPYSAVSNAGKRIRVKKTDTSANTVTIDPNGSQTIDGDTTRIIAGQYGEVTIESDGANWHVVGTAPGIGVWTITPNANLTLTAGTSVGRFFKDGKKVHIQIGVVVNTVSGSDAVTLTLPFAAEAIPSNSDARAILNVATSGVDIGDAGMVAIIGTGGAVMSFLPVNDNAALGALTNSQLTNGDTIFVSGSYVAAT